MKINAFNIAGGLVTSGSVVTETKTAENSTDKAAGKIVAMNVTLDFKGVAIEKIIAWACETLVIRAQARFRKFGYDWMKSNVNYQLDVAEFFSGERAVKSKEQHAKEYAAGLDKEELKKHIEELKALLNK